MESPRVAPSTNSEIYLPWAPGKKSGFLDRALAVTSRRRAVHKLQNCTKGGPIRKNWISGHGAEGNFHIMARNAIPELNARRRHPRNFFNSDSIAKKYGCACTEVAVFVRPVSVAKTQPSFWSLWTASEAESPHSSQVQKSRYAPQSNSGVRGR